MHDKVINKIHPSDLLIMDTSASIFILSPLKTADCFWSTAANV